MKIDSVVINSIYIKYIRHKPVPFKVCGIQKDVESGKITRIFFENNNLPIPIALSAEKFEKSKMMRIK